MPLNFSFSVEDERLREDVRAFLDAELTDDIKAASRRTSGMFVDRAVARAWQEKLHRRGWGAVHWPTEYGGTGWSPAQLFIYREECARAGAPSVLNQGTSLLAPALFAYGSDEHKRHYLPRMLTGDHEVNQVFFDQVRVPVANRVGLENQGWTVAKHLLEYERGSGGVAAGLKVALEELKRVARHSADGAAPLIEDPAFAARLRQLEIRFQALEFIEMSTLARLVARQHPGSGASSQFKIASVDVQQAIETLRLEAAGHYGVPAHTHISLNDHRGPRVGPDDAELAASGYLTGRAASIYGGSHQVQRNIIAKAVLGL